MDNSTLNQAPDEIILAVDIICLLERNNIAPETALKALEIVKIDFEKKAKIAKTSAP